MFIYIVKMTSQATRSASVMVSCHKGVFLYRPRCVVLFGPEFTLFLPLVASSDCTGWLLWFCFCIHSSSMDLVVVPGCGSPSSASLASKKKSACKNEPSNLFWLGLRIAIFLPSVASFSDIKKSQEWCFWQSGVYVDCPRWFHGESNHPKASSVCQCQVRIDYVLMMWYSYCPTLLM